MHYFFSVVKITSVIKLTLNIMRRINLKNVVWEEGKYYVSWNLNTGVSSFGDTKKEALSMNSHEYCPFSQFANATENAFKVV